LLVTTSSDLHVTPPTSPLLWYQTQERVRFGVDIVDIGIWNAACGIKRA
jgi:hypothetical protein